ncbi:hypothetical protein CEXT_47981 [Caerostris extrusa]|uniref:Uncharacterized protein n=1 Tax=Caerostris extrusa TaxID=172846 RepID=A0AAV4QNZ5_CAEEX|nr:hypothetical protein CEXT_47981 [Caerostris extrusa]
MSNGYPLPPTTTPGRDNESAPAVLNGHPHVRLFDRTILQKEFFFSHSRIITGVFLRKKCGGRTFVISEDTRHS